MNTSIRNILREGLIYEASKKDTLINKLGFDEESANILDRLCGPLSVLIGNKIIDYYMTDNLAVRPSTINGKGLFTIFSFKNGEKITNYYGQEMTLTEFKRVYGLYKFNSLHTYRMKRINKIIVAKEEPYSTLNLINYINECITPNCVLKKRGLYAIHDIEANEELTLLYPKDYYRGDYVL